MQLPRATRLVIRIAGVRMYLWRASTMKARSSTCWFSAGATLEQR